MKGTGRLHAGRSNLLHGSADVASGSQDINPIVLMKEDTAGRIHRDQYGRSDKVNAPENQNREFRDGYRAAVDTHGEDAIKMIIEEGQLRTEIGDDLPKGFDEWERGFWAARCQMAAAGIKKRKKR